MALGLNPIFTALIADPSREMENSVLFVKRICRRFAWAFDTGMATKNY
jgi:hypothetical protein